MKSAKRWFAVILTLALLLASVSPLSAAAKASDGHKNDPYKDCVVFEDRGNIINVIPRDENGPLSVRFPEEANPDLDWDGILEQIRTLIYTDVCEINISAYGMKYPDDYAYFHNQVYYNPVFLRTPVRLSYYPSTGIVSRIYIENENYLDGAENLRKYNACLDAIEQIMYGVKDDDTLSLADKCLLLHDRLAAWCEYDYVNYLAKYYTHTGDIPDSSYSPYGPLVLRCGVCNGIALAYGWMMDILGVENYYTSSDDLNHGWNMVYLDGEPYYLDVTHDDPVWDVTGRVLHRYFLVSFNTYSAGHDNATDFPDTPVSTLYEDYFCKDANTEVVYIGGDLYYLNMDNGNIVRRTPAGEETVVKTIAVRHYYAKDGSNWSTPFYPKMTSIGSEIIYLAPREVHAYNPLTDEDRVVFTPSDGIFPEDIYRLTGLQQIDGVVYVTASNSTNFSENTKADYTESFPFCAHENTVTLAQTFGATCLDGGSAKILCADCRMLTYPQEISFGPHDFTVQNPVPEALAAAAACMEPAAYYYSCSRCGAVEENGAHTFTFGEPGAHSYTAAIAKDEALKAEATCQSAAEYYYSCSGCGAVENNDAHTFISGETGEHQWAWVVDKEPTCGEPGVKHQECTVCRATQNENDPIGPTGDHDWAWIVDTEPTCGAAGAKHEECTLCHAKQNIDSVIQPTGSHTWNSGVATTPPTCTEEGIKTYTCTVCGATRPERMGKTDHTDGNGDGYCDYCSADLTADRCPYCGWVHTGAFGGIIKVIHNLFWFFKNLFHK